MFRGTQSIAKDLCKFLSIVICGLCFGCKEDESAVGRQPALSCKTALFIFKTFYKKRRQNVTSLSTKFEITHWTDRYLLDFELILPFPGFARVLLVFLPAWTVSDMGK